MGAGSDIRAGKAYVELYLDKSLLVKGLKGVASELRAFGAGVSSMGKQLMAAGLSVTAPMLVAAKSWASSGAELYRMSQRTGMAVEQLSALKFAAESSGVEMETLETSIKKMQKAVYAAAQGKGEGPAFLHGLVGMGPEQQLDAIADKLAGVTNPAERAAVAMEIFGRGGTAMLPMLAGGAKGLAEFRKEAEAMGMIRSKESAEAALALSVAWTHVTGAVNSLKNALGSAIGPMLTGFLNGMRAGILVARDWIKDHQPLVQTLFKIGAVVTGVGAGLYVFGKTVSIVGNLFSWAGKLIGVFARAIDFAMAPVKFASSLLSSVLSGALGIVKGAFSMAGDVISGGFTVALWGLKTVLSAVTVGFHVLASAVTIGINVFTAAVSAITTLVALGPVGIIAAIVGAVAGFVLLGASGKAACVAVKSGLASAKDAVSDVDGAVRNVAASMTEKGAAAGAKIRDGVVEWAGSVQSFAVNVSAVAKQVFNRLSTDAKAGFDNLVSDIGGSWDILQTLLSTGHFAEAFKLSLSIVKLEWVRFKNWLSELWEELTPKINVAVSNVAGAVGDMLANLKVGWGDVWDALQRGLQTFLKVLDTALDSARKYIAMTQAFFGEKYSTDSGPPLQMLVPEPRSAEQKAADDKAAREQGKSVAGAIKDAATITEKTPAEAAAAKAARDKAEADATREMEDAKAHAAAVAADAAKKRKEELDKLTGGAGGAGGPGDMALQMATGAAQSRGTFSATAVGGLAEGGPIQKLHTMLKEKMEKFIFTGQQTTVAVKQLKLEAAP